MSVKTVVGTGGNATTTTINAIVNDKTMKFITTGLTTISNYHIDNSADIYYNPNTGAC